MAGSTKRLPDDRGFVNPSRLPRGPNGRALCRRCGLEVPVGRKSFCSDQCVHEWKLTTNPGYQREFLFRRDHGVCGICNIDTEELWRWRRYAFHHVVERFSWPFGGIKIRVWGASGLEYRLATDADVRFFIPVDPDTRAQVIAFLRTTDPYMRGRETVPVSSLWDADHIVPVAEGGGGCGLENLRTLCRVCHGRVTAELRTRLAGKKKEPPTV